MLKHSHRRFEPCAAPCPRVGMSDGPCAVCGAASDPMRLVATGGGCDYPTCSEAHHDAVWLAIDASQAAMEVPGVAPAPWPIAHLPSWLSAEEAGPVTGTVEDLNAWHAVPAHKAAVAAVRGE